MILRLLEISDAQTRAQLYRSCIGLDFIEQGADQGGFANAVGADDPDSIPAIDREVEIDEKFRLAIRLAYVFGNRDKLAAFRGIGEAQSHDIQFDRALDHFIANEAVKYRLASPGLLGPLTGLVTPDELLFLTHLVLLFFVHAGVGELPFASQVDVLVIIAGVFADHSPLDLDDAIDHPIQQPAIMADHHHRTRILIRQKILQPLTTGNIKVIRRLIKQEQVRFFQQQFRQRQPPLLPSGEHGYFQPELII